jgi:hypothetical protein
VTQAASSDARKSTPLAMSSAGCKMHDGYRGNTRGMPLAVRVIQ